MFLAKSLLGALLVSSGAFATQILPTVARPSQPDLKIETTYDPDKDESTVRLAPVQISGENGKYRSLHMSPAFSYRGKELRTPEIVDFELRTVVKGRLDPDLYVLFVIDSEQVFLSSNRWAIKRPVPGRVWVGERLVFRMPYETFVKITKAQALEIRFDDVRFALSKDHLRMLRAFGEHMQSGISPRLAAS